MPTLLSLPPELRAAISELALTHASPFSIAGIYPDYHGPGATTPLATTHLALTQTNQQLRTETLPMFYACNTFAICLQPAYVTYTRVVTETETGTGTGPGMKLKKKTRKRGVGKIERVYKRSYGDYGTSEWLGSLHEEAVRAIRMLRVYVACVTRWQGDEECMERDKCRAYEVAELPTAGVVEGMVGMGVGRSTKGMTVHVLYDGCSGTQLFYEVDLEKGGVGWRGLLRWMRERERKRVVVTVTVGRWRGEAMSVRFV